MSATHEIYVGQFGDYAIPDEVMERAKAMNGARRLDDMRTKGAKFIERWGRNQDGNKEMAAHLEAMIGKQRA